MEEGLILVDTMYEDLTQKGFVSIYGIQFDFNSSEVKQESEPVLNEIASSPLQSCGDRLIASTIIKKPECQLGFFVFYD